MANTHREIVHSIKQQLKTAVEGKFILTRERVAYKASSRGTIPESERWGWFASIDSRRKYAKDRIRHLHLAYGYVRGQSYKRMEPKCKAPPNDYWVLDILSEFKFPEATPELLDITEWLAGDPSIFSWEDADPEARVVEEVAA